MPRSTVWRSAANGGALHEMTSKWERLIKIRADRDAAGMYTFNGHKFASRGIIQADQL
jgi:hypothetical protein